MGYHAMFRIFHNILCMHNNCLFPFYFGSTGACVVFASFTGGSGTVAAYYLLVEGVTVLNNFFHGNILLTPQQAHKVT